jgi:CubicO group peptidase (beta-lactamase class C family)
MVDAASEFAPPLNSFLVWQGGKLAVEEYFHGMGPNELVNVKSASKSVLSALTGLALAEGHLESIDQPLVDFFPNYMDTTGAPEKKAITLRHVLTMRACLESTSFHNYGEWVASSHWLRAALQRPVVCEPGSDMVYSTGNSHIMSAIITETSGTSALAFARRHLLEPLDISRISWDRSPEGYYMGGNNMALTPRALLKFGRMYLNDGRYEDRQVIPADWVERSWETYGYSQYSHHAYGFFWWIDEYAGQQTFFAWGYGGQYVFIVPTLDLVVVCTSSLNDRLDGDRHNERLQSLLSETVIPAVTAG